MKDVNTEEELRVVQFNPKDEELDEHERKLIRAAARLEVPVRDMSRMELREIGGIIAKVGQDIVIASHDERTAKALKIKIAWDVDMAQQRIKDYRRIAAGRVRKRGDG